MEHAEFKADLLGEVRLEEEICPAGSKLDPVPEEVQVAFERRNQTAVVELENATAEKLMPCGMRYPEPFRARPNFFIPILAVCSYVVPFFMLLFVTSNLHYVPGLAEVMHRLYRSVEKIYVPAGVPNSILILFFIMLPMLVGGLLAYALSKNNKLSLKKKMLIWFVPVFLLVTTEILSSGFLTNTEPYPARGIDSAR